MKVEYVIPAIVCVVIAAFFAVIIVQVVRHDAYNCRAKGGNYFYLGGCAYGKHDPDATPS